MAEWLGQRYQIQISHGTVEDFSQPFDLAIVDGVALDRLWKDLQARKEAEAPLFLPLLLITSRQDVGMVTRHLWQSIDEFITIPIEKIELLARVEVLLRARHQSVELAQANRQLKCEEEIQRFMAEVSALLSFSLNYKETLQKVAHLALPFLGDYCVFKLLKDDGTSFERVALAHRDPTKEALAQEFEYLYPPDQKRPHPLERTLADHQPIVIPEITDEILESMAYHAEHIRLLRQFNLRSAMHVPLVARDRLIGIVTFASAESGRHYSPEDLVLAEGVARRAAVAIDNMQLYQKLQKALETQKELDYLKTLFMSMANHELRTPLTVIKGYTQIMEYTLRKQAKTLPDDQDGQHNQEKILQYIERVLHQTDRMNNLIEQLLDFSRIQNRKLELHVTEEVNLIGLVKRLVEQYNMMTSTHSFQLQAPEEYLTVSCDEPRLEQVLNNLITNAVKYSPPETMITVGAEHFVQESGQQEVMIWVQDRGAGISKEHQDHLFDRFYRIRTDENVKVDGLGLGLYISHEIVVQHGGKMWLESNPGEGSTFYFSIPMVPPSKH
jgi:signal transduction histidine kinase